MKLGTPAIKAKQSHSQFLAEMHFIWNILFPGLCVELKYVTQIFIVT